MILINDTPRSVNTEERNMKFKEIFMLNKFVTGLSVFPTAYFISVINNCFSGLSLRVFDFPNSFFGLIICIILDFFLKQFNIGLDKNYVVGFLLVSIVLILINAFVFLLIVSIFPKKWQSYAGLILFTLLIFLNLYDDGELFF